ncbi:MAG: hypothetical protein M5U25_20265 [Planctomycetota bacterium]|nr:hypothetical protein [Planctomycetota bacterium]
MQAAAGDRVQGAALAPAHVPGGSRGDYQKPGAHQEQQQLGHAGGQHAGNGAKAAADTLAETVGVDVLDEFSGLAAAPGNGQ